MSANPAASWHHSNQYSAESACEHCGGVVRHERWCLTCDPLVKYAYGIVVDAEKLTLRDRLILHALGVSWAMNQCQGGMCQYDLTLGDLTPGRLRGGCRLDRDLH